MLRIIVHFVLLFCIMSSNVTAGEQIPPKAFSEVQQERWGYINNKGTLVIDYQFEFADSFTEGLAAVKINNK